MIKGRKDMDRKLNTLSLSGLMIGPILGSGIVLLPPMAIRMLGDKAILAWIIMMLLGTVFGYVFVKMSLLVSSNEGVSLIIGEKLGQAFREMSSNYLTAAVCFGPVAVLNTASGFICGMLPGIEAYRTFVTFVLLALSVTVLLMGIKAMGRMTLVLSSLTALILVIGSSYSLVKQGPVIFPRSLPEPGVLGSTLLLLFWAIVGWEVIGNYVEEVENPARTIMRALKISLGAVVLVYLLSTFALQNSFRGQIPAEADKISMSLILVPLFGNFSYVMMGVIATGLCYCTLIMILGAVTRQMAARAEKGNMPAFLRQRKGERSPKRALLLLTLFHCLLIVLIHYGYVSVEWAVGIANTFFIGNAILGLVAGFKCVSGNCLRGMIILLTGFLGILLAFSSLSGWVLLALVSLLSAYKNILHSGRHLKSEVDRQTSRQ